VDHFFLIEHGGELFHPRIRDRDFSKVDLLIAPSLLPGQGVEDRGFSAEGQTDETGFHSSLYQEAKPSGNCLFSPVKVIMLYLKR
jgi:hypothetical protein